MRKAWQSTALASLLALASTFPALAQDKITLKFAHLFPASHYLWEQGGKPYAEAITAATKGQVQFEVYPAGQLGKDYVALLKSGVADMVILVPTYAPNSFPMSSVVDLPGLYATACEGTGKFWSIARADGPLNEAEYKPQGIHVLWTSVLDPYRIMTTGKPVTSLDDLAGLKIRANAGAMDKTVRALGGVSVRTSSPELYDALTRGTVDAALYPYSGILQFKLEKILRHAVEGVRLGSGSIMFAMSERAWKALPENAKAAMNEAALPAQKHLCEYQDVEGERIRQKIVAEDGFKTTSLSPEQAALWEGKVGTVAAEWAEERDKMGKAGTAMLKAFKGAGGSQ
ncbi:TRAP transporter substrate-binding protein DctP [Bosea sp. ASV33]|uniref:TRAP transporter substrate-binding protein n=1 Tax=Bosea sp. ASV33 TaxID=2795106 RepID=UPI0018EC651D|nr:TRAP transporter substrate-binding protein DctP [Bosea sp. ASV33]